MSDFKGRHYRGEIILGCVRWYCKYRIRPLSKIRVKCYHYGVRLQFAQV